MTLHRRRSSIIVALAVAALAVPLAQAGSARPNLAAETEARGYAALSQAILNTSRLQSQNDVTQTEAKGYAALSQAILNTSQLQRYEERAVGEEETGDLVGPLNNRAAMRKAARRLCGPDRGQRIRSPLASDREHEPEPGTVQFAPRGFDWGDAGIGAAATLGLMLFAGGLAIGLVVRERSRQPKHA